jgi:hypothetical protein
MKQGRASVSNVSDVKREPISHAVDVCTVADIGQVTDYNSRPLYEGRGYQAPMVGTTSHKGGSQGRHE